MTAEIIRETISVTRSSIPEEDKAISADYNRVIRLALAEAEEILMWGTTAQKMQIVRAALQAAGRLAAVDSKVEVETARIEFEAMLDEVRAIPEMQTVITDHAHNPTEYVDVEAKALPESPLYQNDE